MVEPPRVKGTATSDSPGASQQARCLPPSETRLSRVYVAYLWTLPAGIVVVSNPVALDWMSETTASMIAE